MSHAKDPRLARARTGILALGLPDAVAQGALTNLARWLTDETFADYRPQVASMLERERFELLADAFHRVLPFGTGGRRGAVGVGPNRINPWTIGTSVQGHVDWLRAAATSGGPLRVVVAYDVRRFEDAEGIWDRDVPNPVLGLTSRDLAELAVRIYAANGVDAWILPRGGGRFVSTPELSYTIRALGAQGGLNLSASHNPPDDNGIKVYDARGAQLVPPDDEHLLRAVGGVVRVRTFSWEEAIESGRVRFLDDDPHRRYVDLVAGLADPDGPRDVAVVFSPLHGSGCVDEALHAAGFSCDRVEAQAEPDGRFPTVPGHVANPERPEALELAIRVAGDTHDLVLATDPDADRIGAVVRHAGRWVHLSGNEIGALLVHHRLLHHHGRRPLVITTEVTSSLVGAVARAAGAAVIDDLLVGFKYVAEVLRQLEEEGSCRDIRADEVAFLAGIEESNGGLLTPEMRDKDSAGGGVILAEAAAEAKARGRTLVDVLDALLDRHGYILNTQLNLKFPGATGQARMHRLLDGFRAAPPRALAGRVVSGFSDHRDPSGRFGPILSESDLAARNVLVFHLAPSTVDQGARVILRPSGTEPKLKIYLEVRGSAHLDRGGRAAVDAEIAGLSAALGAALGV